MLRCKNVASKALAIAVLTFLFANNASAQRMVARVDAATGLPELTIGGASAIKMTWVFWGAKWAWASFDASADYKAPLTYALKGNSPNLGLQMFGSAQSSIPGGIATEMTFNASQRKDDVIGGGVAVRIDMASFGALMGEPEILPDKKGIAWGKSGANRVEWRFDQPVAVIYKERGQSNEIRVMFYSGSIEPGTKVVNAKLTVFGDIKVEQSLAEKFGTQDIGEWAVSTIGPDHAGPDLSFLNTDEKPAGKRGFVRAVGDKLVFADGTQARFWGTNITAYSIFSTTQDNVKLAAKRLSSLGYNLVRLHHHDSTWVSPNVFGVKPSNTSALDEAAMEKYDWWVKCLKDEGIYIWSDLHVGRGFMASDQIDDFEELAKGKSQFVANGANYVNQSVKNAMKRYNEQFFTRKNRYTGLKYADEPAIVAFLITNENDVTHHFGNAFLADKNVPKHHGLMKKEADAFASKWGLSSDKTMRTWEPGPSKLFLADWERRFNVEMIAQLKTLGVKVPIVTTNYWGDEPLFSIPPLVEGDLVDAHAYGKPGFLEFDPSYAATPLHVLALGQVQGKPYSITEWNTEPFPGPDRHALPLMMAAVARHQGWDALMQYAHTQAPMNGPTGPENWSSHNDPSMLPAMIAAALIYRRADVKEATTGYAFTPSAQQLFGSVITPHAAPALRAASELGRLTLALPQTKELPWVVPASISEDTKRITDPQGRLSGTQADQVVSDTRELKRNWVQGFYQIETARTQALSGWISTADRSPMRMSGLEVLSRVANASVVVQSLSIDAIEDSDSILVSLITASAPKTKSRLPFVAQPFVGTVKFKGRPGLVASFSGHLTNKVQTLTTRYDAGWYTLTLEAKDAATWVYLKRGKSL